MTQLTNTFQTFDAIGIREDLSDIIANISPTDTPVLTMAGKTKAEQRYHEWQTDALRAAATNAQLEGDEFTATAVTATKRVGNRTQISRVMFNISETENIVKKAGREYELAYQLAKQAKELKRDMEFTITGNQSPVTGNDTTASQLAPLCSWYQTNTNRGSGGSNATFSGSGEPTTSATDGTQQAFTEANLKSVINSIWANSGRVADTLLMGIGNKSTLAGFSANSISRRIDAEEEKLVAGVSIYVSDVGEHKVVLDHFSRFRDVHVLNMDYLRVAYLRPFKTVDLAKTGDAVKGFIVVEYTLEVRNEASCGIVADTNAAS